MFDENEIFSEEQTATALSLTVATLRNWRSQRRGPPAVKIGRKCFYRRESVMNWVASREGAVSAEKAGTLQRKHQRRGK